MDANTARLITYLVVTLKEIKEIGDLSSAHFLASQGIDRAEGRYEQILLQAVKVLPEKERAIIENALAATPNP